ncbi:MAG TPA: ParB N-terminal domain-containing protein [Bacilli bacterium]
MEEMKLVWVNINHIIANPLNPRTNHSIKSEEMQRIIKNKGWETGITCYEKGSKYVILSGHRRWYAAKKLAIQYLPIVLVKAPESNVEELERLGSVQGGKVDWSVYEWAKYTYEMWIKWNKCSFEELSRKMDVKGKQIAIRVKVFQYYPHTEIEEKLTNGKYSMLVLYRLIGWLEKLTKYKSDLVAEYKIDLIRTTMLRKIEKGLVSAKDINNDVFIRATSDNQMRNFLLDSKKKLSDALLELNEDVIRDNVNKSLKAYLAQINSAVRIINKINAGTRDAAKEILGHFESLKKEILKKQDDLRGFVK